MVIAHLSDFHVSRHGSILTQFRSGLTRAVEEPGWEPLRAEDGWRIEVHRVAQRGLFRRDRLRLVDDGGLIHRQTRLTRDGTDEQAALDDLLRLLEKRRRTSSAVLARRFPGQRDVADLLATDPDNSNVRFCALAHALRKDAPDRLVITGDLTDDGDGYELILEGLAPFVEKGQLVCIPGNHDIYPSPPLLVKRRERKTLEDKRRGWGDFAESIGLPRSGSFVKDLGEGVALVCLDSCHPPAIPASASGMVPEVDLQQIAAELSVLDGITIRLGCVHHHIVNPPINSIGLSPFQPGMRLRNAQRVFHVLKGLRLHAVMNGHRHVGYRFHPPHAPLFLSAPSSTVGCRSGAKPFYWRLELSRQHVTRVDEVPIPELGGISMKRRG